MRSMKYRHPRHKQSDDRRQVPFESTCEQCGRPLPAKDRRRDRPTATPPYRFLPRRRAWACQTFMTSLILARVASPG